MSTDPVETILQTIVATAVNQQLEAFVPPNQQLSYPGEIPNLGAAVSDYSLNLSGGSVTSASTTLTSFSTTGTNTYACAFTSSLSMAYSTWTESYYETGWGSISPTQLGGTYGGFTCGIGSLDVSFSLTVSGTTASVSGGSATPSGITFNLPSQSVLTGNLPCVQTQVNQYVESAIAGIDFWTPIENAINSALNPQSAAP
jgi:hypothetical protein